MKKFIAILILCSINSFGQTLKSKKIDFDTVSTFSDLKDSTTYEIDKNTLLNLISKNKKKYTLVVSYGFWCKPCNEYLPKLLNFINENKEQVELVLINVEPDDSKRLYLNYYYLLKRFNYTKPIFMISETYSKKKWKKYDSFLIDLISKDVFNKTMGGMSQHILYESNKIVYLSNYNLTDDIILSDLSNIMN
jgi:thiol-disulfide isomerase/thioredoxin